jgi:hypothetical protein
MSYSTFRDRQRPRKTKTSDAVVHALCTLPHGFTRDYVAALPDHNPRTIKRALFELHASGLLRGHRVIGMGGQGGGKAMRWQPTRALIELWERGESVQHTSLLERDNWKPQPWVHPIRAKALGLTPPRKGAA